MRNPHRKHSPLSSVDRVGDHSVAGLLADEHLQRALDKIQHFGTARVGMGRVGCALIDAHAGNGHVGVRDGKDGEAVLVTELEQGAGVLDLCGLVVEVEDEILWLKFGANGGCRHGVETTLPLRTLVLAEPASIVVAVGSNCVEEYRGSKKYEGGLCKGPSHRRTNATAELLEIFRKPYGANSWIVEKKSTWLAGRSDDIYILYLYRRKFVIPRDDG